MTIGSSADVPGTHMRSTLVLLLAALLAGCAAAPPALRAPGDDRVRRFTAEVSGAGALPHLQALQRIADANGGNRASPGPGYEASVDYVAGVSPRRRLRRQHAHLLGEGGSAWERPAKEVVLRQVIAQTRTGDPAKVVMAGAHLDSVPDGPGINDNGSGVAALLEIATRLGGSPQCLQRRPVRFLGIGGGGPRRFHLLRTVPLRPRPRRPRPLP